MTSEHDVAGVRGPANVPTRTWSHVGFDVACGAAGGITVIGALIAGAYAISKPIHVYERVLEEVGR